MYEEEVGEPFPMEQIGDHRMELMHAIVDTIVWHFPGSRTAVARVSRLSKFGFFLGRFRVIRHP